MFFYNESTEEVSQIVLPTSWTETGTKLTASDGASGDNFGTSVSLTADGSLMAVGAELEDPGTTDAGSVYIFQNNNGTWTQLTKLTASDRASNDRFGTSVSFTADGSLLAVGAYLEDPGDPSVTNAGSVYIFQNQNGSWTQLTKLTASDRAVEDRFGLSVSFTADGSLLAVGAYVEDPSGVIDAGSVYIFQNNNGSWTELTKLTASDKASGDAFGTSVSFTADGSLLAVGSMYEDPGNPSVSNAGSVYMFQNNNGSWTQLTKLTASDRAVEDRFGRSVSFTADGSLLAVGAHLEDPGDPSVNNAGSVYIFQNNNGTWTQLTKLTASDRASGDLFGAAVSFTADGSLLAVGAFSEDPSGISDAGSVYIFQGI